MNKAFVLIAVALSSLALGGCGPISYSTQGYSSVSGSYDSGYGYSGYSSYPSYSSGASSSPPRDSEADAKNRGTVYNNLKNASPLERNIACRLGDFC